MSDEKTESSLEPSAMPVNCDDWARFFDDIFGPANQRYALARTFRGLSAHLGYLKSKKFYNEFSYFSWQFGKSVAWTFGVYNHLMSFRAFRDEVSEKTFSQLILRQFPKMCPYCEQAICNGDPAKHSAGSRKRKQAMMRNIYARLQKDPANGISLVTIDSWAEMIGSVYPLNESMTLSDISEKVGEEYAELADAAEAWESTLSTPAIAEVCVELADFFSWLCVFGQAVSGRQHGGKSLDSLVWGVYREGCPKCESGRSKCVCKTTTRETAAERAFRLAGDRSPDRKQRR